MDEVSGSEKTTNLQCLILFTEQVNNAHKQFETKRIKLILLKVQNEIST